MTTESTATPGSGGNIDPLNRYKSKDIGSGLKPCPCGKTPTVLCLVDSGKRYEIWAQVSGDCCGEWSVEVQIGFKPLDSKEAIGYALRAWNNAPRGH